jgi:hypothetical protein
LGLHLRKAGIGLKTTGRRRQGLTLRGLRSYAQRYSQTQRNYRSHHFSSHWEFQLFRGNLHQFDETIMITIGTTIE